MSSFGFPKRLRLLRPQEFDRVFELKYSQSDSQLIIYGMPNDLGHARLGMVISRKHGNAVQRNRWKRNIREVFRLKQNDLPALDLVCLPRGNVSASFQQLMKSLPRLVCKLDMKLSQRPVK